MRRCFPTLLLVSYTTIGVPKLQRLPMNFIASGIEKRGSNNSKGSNPLADSSLDAPGYVHLIGSWTTLDCQLSYEFGDFEELGPKTAGPGYSEEGKRVASELAILPKLE